MRMEVGCSIETARNAIGLLLSVHDASSFAESSPLRWVWRDSEAASRHAVANPEICAEVHGRAPLGLRKASQRSCKDVSRLSTKTMRACFFRKHARILARGLF